MPQLISPSLLADTFTTFDAKLNQVYTGTPTEISKIAMTVPTSGSSTKHGWLKEVPGMREFVGSRVVHSLDANGYEITNVPFELTLGVRRTDIEDEQVGVYSPWIDMAASTAALEADYQAFDLLVDGFSKTCYDGNNFFASRTWKGLTIDNSSVLPLTASNFATLKQQLRATVSRKGSQGERPLIPNPEFRLVVGPELETTARSIIEMEFVNGGDSNVNKGASELMVTGYLHQNAGSAHATDARNYWFIEVRNAPGGIMPLIYQEREAFRSTNMFRDTDYNVFDTDEYLYGVYRRFGLGYGLWQLIVGSTGTGA